MGTEPDRQHVDTTRQTSSSRRDMSIEEKNALYGLGRAETESGAGVWSGLRQGHKVAERLVAAGCLGA